MISNIRNLQEYTEMYIIMNNQYNTTSFPMGQAILKVDRDFDFTTVNAKVYR